MNSNSSLAKEVMYNILGTFFYFFCQWLITVLVVRLSGYEDAGILSLIISTTNLFYCIAHYGIRNYQVSDINKEYSDSDYFAIRLVTITISLFLFIISIFILKFEMKILIACIIYIVFKYQEAISDVFFGMFQRYASYENIFFSYFLKGLLSVISFAFTLQITGSLSTALFVNVLIYGSLLILYDYPKIKKHTNLKLKQINVLPILKKCFPLMLYGCMVPYLNFITRFLVEKEFGTEVLGYYSSVTMVFVVMSTLMGSVFVSVIPRIARLFQQKNYALLKKMIYLVLIYLLFGFVLVSILAHFIGDYAFTLVFNERILPYMYLLAPTIMASFLLTAVSFLSSTLVALNQNNKIFIGNAASVIICTMTVFPFIKHFQMVGTLYSLSISLFISTILLFILIMKSLKS